MEVTISVEIDIDDILDEMSYSEKTELCAQLIEEGYAADYFPDGINANPADADQAWIHSMNLELPKPLTEFLEAITGKIFGRC